MWPQASIRSQSDKRILNTLGQRLAEDQPSVEENCSGSSGSDRQVVSSIYLSAPTYISMEVYDVLSWRKWCQHEIYSIPRCRTIGPSRSTEYVIRWKLKAKFRRQRPIIVVLDVAL